jgi:hypothetical protein
MIMRLTLAISIFAALTSVAEDRIEQFEGWEPLTFRKIPKHSAYKSTTINDPSVVDGSVVRLEADASASGMMARATFAPRDLPYLTFRWKIDQIWKKGNATRKDGDDYPVRIYVAFVYDPKAAGFGERVTFSAAKLRFGEYPPHSSLNYIWANRKHKKRILASPYTDRAQLVLVDQGSDHVGTWRTHTVNILDDYRKAFGKAPPKEAQLAIMIDADNTGHKGTAWIDFIRLSATPPKN